MYESCGMSGTTPSITNKASQPKQEKNIAVLRNCVDQKRSILAKLEGRVNTLFRCPNFIINKQTFMNTHKLVC